MKTINEVLLLIKEQTGLELEVCPLFVKPKKRRGFYYFDVILSEAIFLSRDFTKLENFAAKYNLIKVAPNGYNKVSIVIL